MKKAQEVYDQLIEFMRDGCAKSEEARIQVIKRHNLSDIESKAFINICTNQNTATLDGLKTCDELNEEYKNHMVKQTKTLHNVEIHPIFSSFYCFNKSTKTSKSKLNKDIAMTLNEWPKQLLNNIQQNKIYKIITDISSLQIEIEQKYNQYLNLKQTKFLRDFAILDSIVSKTGDKLSNHINMLAHRFLSNDIKYNLCIEALTKLQGRINSAFIDLKIGKKDEKTNNIVENCVYTYYDISLMRKTDVIIPKQMYNYLCDVKADLNGKINDLKTLNDQIRNKRKHAQYLKHLKSAKSSEKKRAQSHRKTQNKYNKIKQNKNKGQKKKKKPTNITNNKSKRKRETQQNLLTKYMKKSKRKCSFADDGPNMKKMKIDMDLSMDDNALQDLSCLCRDET